MGAVLEFTAAYDLGIRFQKKEGHHLSELRSHGQQWNYVASQDAVVFVDNHDNQRHNSGDIINFKSRKLYTMAWAFLLAHSYGLPNMISSYDFDDFDEGTVHHLFLAPKIIQYVYDVVCFTFSLCLRIFELSRMYVCAMIFIIGPPMDASENIVSPKFDAITGQCTNGWVCEHRWPEIRRMVNFRHVVQNATVSFWWDNGANQIAFCRGNRGFIAINNEKADMDVVLEACLPPGVYCDVFSGELVGNKCTDGKVVVDASGKARITVSRNIGVLAIHIKVSIVYFLFWFLTFSW